MPLKPALLLALLASFGLYAQADEQVPARLPQTVAAAAQSALPAPSEVIPPSAIAPSDAAAAAPSVPTTLEPSAIDAPVLEATPILTTPARADLWERIRNGFAMQDSDSPLVREHEAWYVGRPAYVKRMVERSKRYLFYIVEEVEKRGMPTEIALLPMIESAFNPQAYSRSRASGIWQFIPSTGKNYGLEQNWWYDGRRDILAATGAALDYLQKLHDQFGSWELALAAYNAGEGNVSRAIARNQAKGLPTDYASLRLPGETRNYVPKLIAVKRLVMQPESSNLALASIPNAPYFTQVTTSQHIDVKLAARLADMPLDEFVSLNPAHNHPVIAAPKGRTLLLPVDKAEAFNANLESYSERLVSWQSYPAKKGERLDRIAGKFGTTVAVLQNNNHVALRRNKLASNQTLLVPLHGNRSGADLLAVNLKSAEPEAAPAAAQTRYRTKRGDTLASVAKRHGVTVAQIKSWNHLKSSRLAAGQRLVVKADAGETRSASAEGKSRAAKRQLYTVRRGDTLRSIARRFNVAVVDLQRWNNLSGKQHLAHGTKVALYRGGDS
jgi:membrane-bound lytic murein transglycosylase D